MRIRKLFSFCLPFAATCLVVVSAALAAPVRQVELHLIIGAEQLTAGSDLELRIYETNGAVRRLPVSHEEPWLPDSTHLIPLKLDVPLETRSVQRFSLYYRPSSAVAAPFEIIAADVQLPSGSGGESQKLLGMTLSGVIARQGELSTEDRGHSGVMCMTDADCDDRRACNGKERCAPHAAGADGRGCIKGEPVVCPVNQVCGDSVGCHGLTSKAVAHPVDHGASAPEAPTPPNSPN